jgi:hypothetical protein
MFSISILSAKPTYRYTSQVEKNQPGEKNLVLPYVLCENFTLPIAIGIAVRNAIF